MKILICTAALALSAAPALAAPVTLDIDMTVEAVGAGSSMAVGSHDLVRVTYDSDAVDAKTGRVRLTAFQHIMKGKVLPSMPLDYAWLNTGAQPTVDFTASVVHGKAITVVLDSATRSFAILSRPDYAVVSRGTYTVGPAHPAP